MAILSKPSKRGGKREGAGRPDEGKKRYAVTLTEENVAKARETETNLSGLLDRLLTAWLERPEKP
ncbi:MAG: type II toxin-antitoxin system CcdA family antitoxin [Verrucomicrobiales bacterium]